MARKDLGTASFQQAFDYILKNEADIYYSQQGLTNYTSAIPPDGSAHGVVNTVGPTVPAGMMVNFKRVYINCSQPAMLFIQCRKGGYRITSPMAKNAGIGWRYCDASNPAILDYGTDGINIFEGGGFSVQITRLTEKTPIYGVDPIGSMITADLNCNAPHVALILGNSISWGTLGNENANVNIPNSGMTHYASRITEQLKSEGINIRRSMRGFGGNSARDIVMAIKSGLYESYRNVDVRLITLESGTNDAVQGSASDIGFKSNVEFIVNYFRNICPNASFLLFGAVNTDTADRVANIGGYRTAMQEVVAGFKSQGLDIFYHYTDVPLSDTNYVETGNGNRVHPRGDTGHLLRFNQSYPVIQQMKFYQDLK